MSIAIFVCGLVLGIVLGIILAVNALVSTKAENHDEAEMGWIARDKDGELWLYGSKPYKNDERGIWNSYRIPSRRIYPERFASVTWEDEEPTKVKLVKSVEEVEEG